MKRSDKMGRKGMLFILFFSLFFSCVKKERTNYKYTEWIKDKNGCNGVRKLVSAENVIRSRNMTKGSYSDFVETFGLPNKIEQDNSNKMLFYYADSSCNKGEIIEGSDQCYIIFYFTNEQFKDISMRCE